MDSAGCGNLQASVLPESPRTDSSDRKDRESGASNDLQVSLGKSARSMHAAPLLPSSSSNSVTHAALDVYRASPAGRDSGVTASRVTPHATAMAFMTASIALCYSPPALSAPPRCLQPTRRDTRSGQRCITRSKSEMHEGCHAPCPLSLRRPLGTRLAVAVTLKPPVHQSLGLKPVTPLLVCTASPRICTSSSSRTSLMNIHFASVPLLFGHSEIPFALKSWYLAAHADVVVPDSSSPSTKRSLKPSPIAANAQPSTSQPAPAELPSLQPATSFTTANKDADAGTQQPQSSPTSRKRKSVTLGQPQESVVDATDSVEAQSSSAALPPLTDTDAAQEPKTKKSRTNTPWTPAEELRLKQMRDAGNSWSEIAKTFPQRTEGSVKKHWYKDMHYAEFAEDESAALLAAIKEYDANKWKVIGQKVGKPAKACEQYAKENFGGKY
ncbi:myb dna-binding domain protein [Stemphylium lycopersici]|nr:myb dna-binding domain protein [Stemphylium lycopersici]